MILLKNGANPRLEDNVSVAQMHASEPNYDVQPINVSDAAGRAGKRLDNDDSEESKVANVDCVVVKSIVYATFTTKKEQR